MINDPAAATSSDDDDNHVHHCSLPKRVIAASRLENLILIFMFQSIFIVVFNLRVLWAAHLVNCTCSYLVNDVVIVVVIIITIITE